MTYTKPRFVYDPNLALYLPFFEMEPGRSGNLLSWNSASPKTGWAATRATLSDETTPTPPVSAKILKILCNDGAGAGGSAASQQVAASRYAGITATISAYGQAASGNALNSDIAFNDGVTALTASAAFAKDDAWHQKTITQRVAATSSQLTVYFRSKNTATANTTDILYGDNPILTFPQMMERSHYGRVCHPDGPSRSQATGISGWIYDGIDDITTSETDPVGTKACTFVFTIRPTGWGGMNTGLILENGKLWLGLANTGKLSYASDGATIVNSAASSISLNTIYRIVVTRTAAGVANFYINGNLSGTADQNSGAPASGTTLLGIGNRIAGDRSFAGIIRDVAVYINTIWGATEVAIDYSEYKAGNR